MTSPSGLAIDPDEAMTVHYSTEPTTRHRGGRVHHVAPLIALGFKVVERGGFYHCMRAPWGTWMKLAASRRLAKKLTPDIIQAACTLMALRGPIAVHVWLYEEVGFFPASSSFNPAMP